MQCVSASTSAGSIAGNMPIRSWLRPELAVRVGVENAVGAQDVAHRVGVDAVVEIDRADDVGPFGGIGDERCRPLAGLGPAVERGRRGGAASGGPRRARRCRASSRAGRRASRAWRVPGCCTSGSGSSCRARSTGRATPDASGRSRRSCGCARPRRASRRRATGRRRRRSTSAGRSSTRRPRRDPTSSPPAAEVASTTTSAAGRRGSGGAPELHRHAGRRLVVRQRVDVDAVLGTGRPDGCRGRS